MKNLEKRLAELEKRRKIASQGPAPSLTQLYILFDQRRAAGQPLFTRQYQAGVHNDPAIY
jgi:hypothetical protein